MQETHVAIDTGRVDGLPVEAFSQWHFAQASDKGVYLAWQDVGAFLVSDGRRIIVEPMPGVDERVLRLCILGTVLAVLLHQRHLAVLHASAVNIAGQAVAFVGMKGAGKSTMAAALRSRGHLLLADDTVAVNTRQCLPEVLPGFPMMKLWPDSLAVLGGDPAHLPRLRPELEKRSQRVSHGFASAPAPLRSIYILAQGSESAIELLPPREALIELMPHWYVARYTTLLRALDLARHFRQWADLVNRVNVYRLRRPLSLQSLAEVAEVVEAHVASDLRQAKHVALYGDRQP